MKKLLFLLLLTFNHIIFSSSASSPSNSMSAEQQLYETLLLLKNSNLDAVTRKDLVSNLWRSANIDYSIPTSPNPAISEEEATVVFNYVYRIFGIAD